ncbi:MULTISPECIES: universal stress protein [unclassified Streptomyces]|uniref:universal stress protein n=1 Tax=unclassified Streptomyces TaxID=2593676 RepID=UPI000360F518|nr:MULTISPECIES: universal stress protein [unclassified Streptomyces]MYX37464.1 universal stress protein [Streptomyces sp. SID8377]
MDTSHGPVVVGTDGSLHATAAVMWAAGEAVLRDRPLHILHATGLDTRSGRNLSPETAQLVLDSGRALLDEAAASATARYPDLAVSTSLGKGKPADTLLEQSGSKSLTVVGCRGRGGFHALLLGSVGLRVASHAHGPVVVVRGSEQPSTGVVLAGIRDETDLATVRFAADEARLRKATLRLLTAWSLLGAVGEMVPGLDDATSVGDREAATEQIVADTIREEYPDLTVTVDLVEASSASGALVDASAHADLLVAGARRHQRGGGRLAHVTHAVLHHAHCPVAVFHHV